MNGNFIYIWMCRWWSGGCFQSVTALSLTRQRLSVYINTFKFTLHAKNIVLKVVILVIDFKEFASNFNLDILITFWYVSLYYALVVFHQVTIMHSTIIYRFEVK